VQAISRRLEKAAPYPCCFPSHIHSKDYFGSELNFTGKIAARDITEASALEIILGILELV
jgi:hypothetical protein